MLRCHACNVRFVRVGRSLARTEDLRKVVRRLAVAAGVLVGAALVLALILWLGTAQPSNPEEQGRAAELEAVTSRV